MVVVALSPQRVLGHSLMSGSLSENSRVSATWREGVVWSQRCKVGLITVVRSSNLYYLLPLSHSTWNILGLKKNTQNNLYMPVIH